MRNLVLLLVVVGLSNCQSAPSTPSAPITLLGHWQCDTATSVEIDRSGRLVRGSEDTSLLDAVMLDVTPTHLRMTGIIPGDTTEWAYVHQQDSLVVHYTRFQNQLPVDSTSTESWYLAALTPATMVVERSFKEDAPNIIRVRWHYHR